MALENSFPLLWYRFRDIEAVDTDGHHNGTQHIDWLPPECPGGFETVRIHPWQILALGSAGNEHNLVPYNQRPRARLYELPANIKLHDTASMFFTSELNTFFEVPYDCTIEHVAQRKAVHEKDGWDRITFFKHADEVAGPRNSNLWCIAHAHKKQMDESISITDSWNELLLPGSFYNGIHRNDLLETCDLAGRLTLIFGLLAFTTAPGNSYNERIRKSFRYPGTSHYVPTWRTGDSQDQGLIHKRGLVIDIAYDQDHHEKRFIDDWEAGAHGPILTCNPSWER